MAIIGLAFVTIVAIGAAVRSTRPVNKALVVLFWGVFAGYSLGWSL